LPHDRDLAPKPTCPTKAKENPKDEAYSPVYYAAILGCLFSFPSSISEWADDNDMSLGRKVLRLLYSLDTIHQIEQAMITALTCGTLLPLMAFMPVMSLSNKLLLRLFLLSSSDVQPRFGLTYLSKKFPDSHIISNETFASEETLKGNSGRPKKRLT
jgi:hypothetical protein